MKSFDDVNKIAAEIFGIPPDQLREKNTRKTEFVKARQMVMYYFCNDKKTTLSRIAAFYFKDHATVIHAKKTISNLIETKDFLYYPLWERFINEVMERFDNIAQR